MATTKPDIKALVAQMPDADKPGQTSKFTGPEPGKAKDIYEAILAGGRNSLLELIGLLRDPNDPAPKDFRAEYVVHGLAICVGAAGKEKQRKMFAETLGSQLARPEPLPVISRLIGRKRAILPAAVQGFLIRELQVAGGSESVKAIGRALSDEALCEPAAQALVAIGGKSAAGQLRAALGKAKGRCRVTIAQNLGVLRDAASVGALRKCLLDPDREVRLAAAWALARIGDAGSVDLVLKESDAEAGWERIKATQACLLLAENLAAAGKKRDAAKIYGHLRDTRTDPKEQYVREVAVRGLAAIG
jgi:HEAT repeat protein